MRALVPKIFISAASKDLGTSRRVVRDALVKLDCLPKEQSDFSLSGKSLVEHLRTLIQDSEGVIHLVGTCFGAEAPPPYTTSDRPRSYTQLEHDLALQLGKPLYVLFCAPDFPFDAHEPEPDVKSTLQLQYREELKRGGIDRRTIRSQEELRAQVLALRIVFDATRKDMARQQRRTRLIAALATGVLVIGGVSGVLYLARQSHVNADNIQSAVAGRGELGEIVPGPRWGSAGALLGALPSKFRRIFIRHEDRLEGTALNAQRQRQENMQQEFHLELLCAVG